MEKTLSNEVTNEERKILFLKDKVELVINETSKPNSFESGKPSERFKTYYSTPEKLKEHLNKLKELGLSQEVINEN